MTTLSYCVGCGGAVDDDDEFHCDGDPGGGSFWHTKCWLERPFEPASTPAKVVDPFNDLSIYRVTSLDQTNISTRPTGRQGMKVYLAGKIEKGGWRDELGMRAIWSPHYEVIRDSINWWHVVAGWPSLQIEPGIDCVGPYALSCDHGCCHGPNTHGMGDGGCVSEVPPRDLIAQWCLAGIETSDVVFARLDDPSCHGTLVELGYAHALKKRIVIALPEVAPQDHPTWDELWFARRTASQIVFGATAKKAWNTFVRNEQLVNKCESPIEVAFWNAAVDESLDRKGLIPAHPVRCTTGNNYRIDFAIPDAKLGVELDGYEHHSSKDQFIRDRKRQRELEADGWRIIRFSGTEVHADPVWCVREFAKFIDKTTF